MQTQQRQPLLRQHKRKPSSWEVSLERHHLGQWLSNFRMSNVPRGIAKIVAILTPQFLFFFRSGWGLRICISNKFPSDAEAVGNSRPLSFYQASPVAQTGKKSPCHVGDWGLIPGLERSFGEDNGNPLQYSCLENRMDRGAWWATVHGVAESETTEHSHKLLLSVKMDLCNSA